MLLPCLSVSLAAQSSGGGGEMMIKVEKHQARLHSAACEGQSFLCCAIRHVWRLSPRARSEARTRMPLLQPCIDSIRIARKELPLSRPPTAPRATCGTIRTARRARLQKVSLSLRLFVPPFFSPKKNGGTNQRKDFLSNLPSSAAERCPSLGLRTDHVTIQRAGAALGPAGAFCVG